MRVFHAFTVLNCFSVEELAKIKELAAPLPIAEPLVLKFENQQADVPKLDQKTRVCGIKWVYPTEDAQWLYMRLVGVVNRINAEVFNLNLFGIEELQYTMYNEESRGFYSAHRDTKSNAEFGLMRKLSFSLQLTDPSEYEGGDLILDQGFHPEPASKKLGDITFFLSSVVHEVTPVTKGERHALVGWISGPPLA
jgi:PKHD-type hydroxylase